MHLSMQILPSVNLETTRPGNEAMQIPTPPSRDRVEICHWEVENAPPQGGTNALQKHYKCMPLPQPTGFGSRVHTTHAMGGYKK